MLADACVDRSPFRDLYIGSKDAVLYAIIVDYTNTVEAVFWRNALPGSFIVRTIGVQALFDILRRIARDAYDARDISVAAFERRLKPAGGIDFAQIEYQNASGAGRSDIRRAIEGALGLLPLGRPRS